MITAILLVAAVYLFAGDAITKRVQEHLAAHPISVDRKHLAAVAMAIAAAVTYQGGPEKNHPSPVPQPAIFSLRGKFVGEHGVDDAILLSALLSELADCIERDGTMQEPRLRTGVAFDDLRIAAREARMRGESLGARQPQVRDAIHAFLDNAVGSSGGPVTPERRSAWVSAYRELARAAAEATR